MENAQTTECKVNLKGVFQAVMLYAADNNDFLPGPSGERTGPHYYKIIRYNKKGDLSRRNKRFASFISPYVDSKVYDEKLDYIPSMICPANENMHELAGDPRIRPQYNILNPPGVAKPFGDHARTNVNGIFVEEKMPKQMSAINNPSDSKALKDARDAASRYATIPDLPVHQDFRENVLFFDGAVETQEVKLIP